MNCQYCGSLDAGDTVHRHRILFCSDRISAWWLLGSYGMSTLPFKGRRGTNSAQVATAKPVRAINGAMDFLLPEEEMEDPNKVCYTARNCSFILFYGQCRRFFCLSAWVCSDQLLLIV